LVARAKKMKEVAQARPTEDLKLKVIAKATPTPTDDEETYSGPVARLPPSPLSILSIVFAFFKMSDHYMYQVYKGVIGNKKMPIGGERKIEF